MGIHNFSLLYVCMVALQCIAVAEIRDGLRDFLQKKVDDLLSHVHHFETVIPQLVDKRGDFMSYHVSQSGVLRHYYREQNVRSKRRENRFGQKFSPGRNQTYTQMPESHDNSSKTTDPNVHLEGSDEADLSSVFYKLRAYGREFHFNLSLNTQLLSKDFAVEIWGDEEAELGRGRLATGSDELLGCHYTGFTLNQGTSDAAISNCNGLHGIFSTDTGYFFVEPLWNHTNVVGIEGHPHVVYSMDPLKLRDIRRRSGVIEDKLAEVYRQRRDRLNSILKRPNEPADLERRSTAKSRHIGKDKHARSKQRMKRSVSLARHVETMVVIDKKMSAFYYHTEGRDTEALTDYALTIMNIVAKLYQDPTIGNQINIVVTRIVVLDSLKGKNLPNITSRAKATLTSFCAWQNRLRERTTHTYHHDNAVLMTGENLCSSADSRCLNLGLADLGSICHKKRSCNINEYIGLSTAFVIAYEMGHNLGMHHDSDKNHCGELGKEPQQIMADSVTKHASPFSWSNCSRKYITDFLDAGRGWCLNNVPSKREIYPTPLPADTYDIDAQCRLKYGGQSKACTSGSKMTCKELMCMNPADSMCWHTGFPAAEGTECPISRNKHGWCFRGECRNPKYEAKPVHGSWGPWGSWGECSRTCESGVSLRKRECDNPKPRDGGLYCTGHRKRYRSCNVKPCPTGVPSFREVQCDEQGTPKTNEKYYEWVPILVEEKPCRLICQAQRNKSHIERLPKIKDGTKCFFDKPHVCINDQCHFAGCDGSLGSKVKEDMCRVCGGNNSKCKRVHGLYKEPFIVGDYEEIVKIPKGATHIKVREARRSRNYLALKDTRDNYFINGQRRVVNGSKIFHLASTAFHHKSLDSEPKSLEALGPTGKDLVVMALAQEQNFGIEYEYYWRVNLNVGALFDRSLYVWSYRTWSACSKSCSGGRKTSNVQCERKSDGRVVNEKYCKRHYKPKARFKYCNTDDCPPEWQTFQWSECKSSCGQGVRTRHVRFQGVRTRRVNCMKGRRHVAKRHCSTQLKPKTTEICRNKDCPSYEWSTGSWTQCKPSCGQGVRTRRVNCMKGRRHVAKRHCSTQLKPKTTETCRNKDCPSYKWSTGSWTQCKPSCGQGVRTRRVNCMKGRRHMAKRHCSTQLKPKTTETCRNKDCPSYKWSTGSWTQCKPSCGQGVRTRRVNCMKGRRHVAKRHCSTQLKPKTTEICRNKDCPSYEWSTGSWTQCKPSCGQGVRTRRVNCMKGRRHVAKRHSSTQLKPKTTEICRNKDCPSYEWSTGSWTQCKPSCGQGVRTRRVNCMKGRRHVAKRHCSTQLKPKTTEICRNKDCPSYEWSTGSWTQCKPSCGQGVRTRRVNCMKGRRHVAKRHCSTQLKPKTTETCRNKDCPSYKWSTGSWTQCKPSCGQGVRTRRVNCMKGRRHVAKRHCSTQLKPKTTEICRNKDCPSYEWSTGSWTQCKPSCGQGVKTRWVHCTTGKLIVAEVNCLIQNKPKATESCRNKDCPFAVWREKHWSECSSSCGRGVRTRSVICMTGRRRVAERFCSNQKKPKTTETCRNRHCPSLKWRKGRWSPCSASCGYGTRQRTVVCQSPGNQQCNKAKRPASQKTCYVSCDNQTPSLYNGSCEDQFETAYCHKIRRSGGCADFYYQMSCCKTCI
ncbi:hypothetical protein RRG08_021821 [Elysia crispata]|uniref:Uncharacterized protein n=1 Tax=Elysia crispata TaxID=231223 RepID=A0AAE0ZZ97_9GAST|nr:hypothetical protein RRG08_021821 [Elysia crispata]